MSDVSLCECGHDHFAPLSQEREQWTTDCPAYACGCKAFIARGSRPRIDADPGCVKCGKMICDYEHRPAFVKGIEFCECAT